ncbi:hypothetical protein CDO27_27250 (plasmid) [Sinorhizobium meliloti]|nr:hypothetical protein CDO27_27250 [Sinorhizobium meliloti]
MRDEILGQERRRRWGDANAAASRNPTAKIMTGSVSQSNSARAVRSSSSGLSNLISTEGSLNR